MAIDVVTRKEWGARTPRARYAVPWWVRTEFFVHHTAGPTDQTIESIQDFHMDGNGWSDIGYNFLVDREGRIYEGRGWLVVGAHCPNHNRSGIGVAFIGDDNPTPEAKRSIRWLYDEACRRAGRTLRMLGHGERYATSCPGPRLQKWVNNGMPFGDTGPQPETNWTEAAVKKLPTLRVGAGRDEDDPLRWDVKTVSALLYARGFPIPAGVDDTVFGDHHVVSLRAFQKAEGLTADAIVGPLTWAALLRV